MHPYVRSYPTSDPSAPVRRSSGAAKRASAPPRKSRKTPVVAPQLAEPDVLADGSGASGPTSDVADVVVEAPVEDPGMTGALPKEDVAQEGVSEAASEEVAKPAAGPVVTVDDFEDIFTRFQTPLINFVFRLVGNREQAYDLTQDVFVKAYRALSGGTTIQAAALSSWLYRIASNTATDALRRRRLINWLPLSLFNEDRGVGAGMPGMENADGSRQGSGDESYPSAATSFAGGYDGGRFEQHVADREVVQTVLKRLPPKYASCLLLYEHEGFSCAEIAEVLSLSPSAVKMRLMRARERFITLYAQETGRQ
ncbi:MAG TPA: RNA polymerase sigma factor [Ktedonobacterales bacterium]